MPRSAGSACSACTRRGGEPLSVVTPSPPARCAMNARNEADGSRAAASGSAPDPSEALTADQRAEVPYASALVHPRRRCGCRSGRRVRWLVDPHRLGVRVLPRAEPGVDGERAGGWTSVVTGPAFVRGDPLRDPTRLLLRTYRDRTPAAALRELSAGEGITASARQGKRVGEQLQLAAVPGTGRPASRMSRSTSPSQPTARTPNSLRSSRRRAELARLARTALLPALDSFTPGPPDAAAKRTRDRASRPVVLADGRAGAPPRRRRRGWTASSSTRWSPRSAARSCRSTASPSSATATSCSIVVRAVRLGHARRAVRVRAPARAAVGDEVGHLDAARDRPQREGRDPASRVKTPVLRLAAARHYLPKNTDARKRAMTIEDLLTMQSGLAWKESGYAYTPGSGNDVMAMLTAKSWTNYVIDRPMAAQPGTTFVYNSGASHLVSGGGHRADRSPCRSARRKAALRAARHSHVQRGSPLRRASRAGGSACSFSRATSPSSLSSTSTTDAGTAARSSPPPGSSSRRRITSPIRTTEYGYLWWLDRADGYAYMAGLYGQLAVVDPGKDLVAVITAHSRRRSTRRASRAGCSRHYILPAAR